ncbi:anti-phage deoxyguanosine triphosphatase [Mannheimia sp. AT1]|uniref:Deoxyguanosinetriphosphate triphosphohydrolase-like protein n=1 Tax=Mannheimia cairinae TaxID=3025936 RepID=A0ABT5MQI6_9PAST|nr:anti-phage deoxyguanosine triphosphatase [Mannheimia cairinae]MDD0824446.1 anti-phage deoxyguanosine triphosphatase [Mannheimia cairinae]MDD0825547.1 anti-phage deoxyguanosine triphosphatase [Mannheimia cairinae]
MISSVWTERYLSDKKREQDHRSPFQRDRARLLHSEAFRCLQAKTQIHAVGEDDFYRTRLTHSLEVAQIGTSLREKLLEDKQGFQAVCSEPKFAKNSQILTALLPSRSLIESLCFAHDLGHPPFGHGGEMALNYKMAEFGGFEGNAQSLRIMTQLEPYTEKAGMNLTRRTLLGVMKYPALLSATLPKEFSPAFATSHINLHHYPQSKGIYDDDKHFFDWILQPLSEQDKKQFCSVEQNKDPKKPNKTRYKSLDCSIMELADDIAYGVHDLEDAIVGGMVTPQSWQNAEILLAECHSDWVKQRLFEIREKLFSQHRYERKDVIGALVNHFITNVRWKELPEFEEPLLRYNAYLPENVACVLKILKDFVYQYVICDAKTQRVERKGQRILMELFDILSSDPMRLLPNNIRERWKNAEDVHKARVISDYLASMSDGQAFKLYAGL